MSEKTLRTALLLTAPIAVMILLAWLFCGEMLHSAVFAVLKLVVTR